MIENSQCVVVDHVAEMEGDGHDEVVGLVEPHDFGEVVSVLGEMQHSPLLQ